MFLRSVLLDHENRVISQLQEYFKDADTLKYFLQIILWLTMDKATLVFGIILFLGSDSLIAFKSTLLHGVGLYITVILKLIYAGPRPFWNTSSN